ncbi:hypothetical protein BaRGS_00002077, partial [Batillaria attramentaria]
AQRDEITKSPYHGFFKIAIWFMGIPCRSPALAKKIGGNLFDEPPTAIIAVINGGFHPKGDETETGEAAGRSEDALQPWADSSGTRGVTSYPIRDKG